MRALSSAPNNFKNDGQLRIDDVCADSKLSRSKVYDEIRAGRLKARKVGRATIVLRSDYTEFLRSLPMAGGGDAKAA